VHADEDVIHDSEITKYNQLQEESCVLATGRENINELVHRHLFIHHIYLNIEDLEQRTHHN